MKPFIILLSFLTALLLFTGCGSKESEKGPNAGNMGGGEKIEIPAEVKAYMDEKVFLGVDVYEDLEAGRITQEEIERRTASGEFSKMFRFATIEDLPKNLKWENGMDLPDLGSPKAKKGGIFYDFISAFPRTLRTVGPDGGSSFRPYLLDWTTLQLAKRHPNDTEITENGFRYFPELAKEWVIDRENRTGYFRLDARATWSDDVPVTVDDFLYTLYFYQSEHLKDPWYVNYYNRNFVNITKYDDHTFSVTVPEKKPDLTTRFFDSVYPIPMHFYGTLDENYVDTYQWRFQPTTGPYVIHEKDINKGRFMRLTRIKDWWAMDKKFQRNRFNFDIIHITVIRDLEKTLEAFLKGELDAFPLTIPKYWHDKLPDSHPDVQKGYIQKHMFYNDIPRPSYALWMNNDMPLLNNRDIRLGLHHSMNWKRVIDEYYRGDYTRMRTNSEGFGAFVNPDIEPRGFDVEKALYYFGKAGFTSRDSNGILINDKGQTLTFTITTPWQAVSDELNILQEEARRTGVDLKLEILDLSTGYKKLDEKKHQIAFAGYSTGIEMYPRYFEYYHSTQAYDVAFLPDGSPNPERTLKSNTNNIQSFASTEVDALIERYRASEDADEMREIAFEMQEIIHDHGSYLPAFVRPFWRIGSWRWIKWPEDFNLRLSKEHRHYYLHWIDEEEKAATLSAIKSGKEFETSVTVYDQYNVYK